MLCSELDNWFVRLPSGERERLHSSKSHHHTSNIHPPSPPTLDCYKGFIFQGCQGVVKREREVSLCSIQLLVLKSR